MPLPAMRLNKNKIKNNTLVNRAKKVSFIFNHPPEL